MPAQPAGPANHQHFARRPSDSGAFCEIVTTNGTKAHEGFLLQIFPSCTLVALVVNDFANRTTTDYVERGRIRRDRDYQGHEAHEGFWLQIFPSCTLVALVVNGFANCTTTDYVERGRISPTRLCLGGPLIGLRKLGTKSQPLRRTRQLPRYAHK